MDNGATHGEHEILGVGIFLFPFFFLHWYIPEALPRPVVLDPTDPAYIPLAAARLFTCLWPLAAQRNGKKRMCSPVYLLMLPICEKLALLTGIHRVGPCPIE